MNPIGTFREDSGVTEEQYKQIDQTVRRSAQEVMVARQITSLFGPLGFGKQAVTFDKLTERRDANVQFAFRPNKDEDNVNLARTTNKIAFIDAPFRIPSQSLAASRTTGTPLDVLNAQSAGYKVALKENAIILDGFAADGTNYDIEGFYQGAGNTEATADDYGTAGNAVLKMTLAMAVLRTDNIFPPYNKVLNPTQYNQMLGLIANTGILEIDVVQRQIKGQIYESPTQTAATGMLMGQAGRGFFDVALGVDVTTELEQMGLADGKDLYGVVYESLAPRIWEDNAICTLTSI